MKVAPRTRTLQTPQDRRLLGIPPDAVELPKVPVVEGGEVVGYNPSEPPPAPGVAPPLPTPDLTPPSSSVAAPARLAPLALAPRVAPSESAVGPLEVPAAPSGSRLEPRRGVLVHETGGVVNGGDVVALTQPQLAPVPSPSVQSGAPGVTVAPRGVKIQPRTPPAPVAPPSVVAGTPGTVVGFRPASFYGGPSVSTATAYAPPAPDPSAPVVPLAPLPPSSDPDGPTVETALAEPYADAQTQEEIALRLKQGEKPHNRQHGFLGNLGGALKSAAIIAGQYAREHPATTWQELAPTLGAAGSPVERPTARSTRSSRRSSMSPTSRARPERRCC